jgi:hypothetical protein
MMGRLTSVVAALALLTACTGVAFAQESKCTSGKLKSAGKKAAGRGKCYVKGVSKGVAPDPACLSKATDAFAKGFSKAEAKADCIAATGDQAAIEAKVDAFIDSLRDTVNGGAPGPSKCDSKKFSAATKKAAAKAGCQAKAAKKGEAVDPACLQKAEGKFTTAVGKAEGGDDCTSTGQAATLENAVDAFIADLVAELTAAATPTTTTTTQPGSSTTTTTNPHVCGNGVVEGPAETCDDGNAVDENTVDPLPPDACPSTCRILSCNSTASTFSVSVNFSSGASIAGYKVFVDYPENKVIVPGTGAQCSNQAGCAIQNDPTNGAIGNDLDYGIIVVGSGLNAIPSPRLFTLNFTSCGITPTVADFNCKVHQASDTNGNDVPMTCSISIP